LEDIRESEDKTMMIMACDHWIHASCYDKYVGACSDRMDLDRRETLELALVGPPCPLCRTIYPMGYQHSLVGTRFNLLAWRGLA
jgi:hypothetical protein